MDLIPEAVLSKLSITSEQQLIMFLASCMMLSGVCAFFALLFTPAPYGKYADSASFLYGPKIPGKMAWILQELPSLVIPLWYWYDAAYLQQVDAVRKTFRSLNVQTVLLSLLVLHYVNRTLIFPLRLTGGKPTPAVVFLMAFAFCCWNGYMQGCWLTRYASYSEHEMLEPHFVLGVLTFFAGMYINMRADGILINLRKPGETGYKIPRGGMFEFVSGANFFGEILEWAGWAIAAWSYPQVAFAFFTFCNIGPRGAQHHEFYHRQFKDYPRNRKAVIPLLCTGLPDPFHKRQLD